MFVTPSTIANWEQGRRNPKEETTQRIADALGVDISALRKSYAVDGDRLCNTLGKENLLDMLRRSNDSEKMNYYGLKFAEYLPQIKEEDLPHLVALMAYLVATERKNGSR